MRTDDRGLATVRRFGFLADRARSPSTLGYPKRKPTPFYRGRLAAQWTPTTVGHRELIAAWIRNRLEFDDHPNSTES